MCIRDRIDIGISSILFNIKDFKFPLFLKLNESDLVQYEGTYSAPNFPMKITITKVGTDLKAQGTDQPSFPLTALGKDKFGFTPADFTITFSPEKKTATIVQSGETIVLTREN